MKRLGGFFGQEKKSMFRSKVSAALPQRGFYYSYGRVAWRDLLRRLKIRHVYIPYFICDSVLEAIQAQGVSYSFLSLNADFEFSKLPILKKNQLLYAVNYFGMKSVYIQKLHKKYQEKVVIDNCHAWQTSGCDQSFQVLSLRKWMGVQKGAILQVPESVTLWDSPKLQSYTGSSYLWDPSYYRQEFLYQSFANAEKKVSLKIQGPSFTDKKKIESFQWRQSQKIRLRNYKLLSKHLKKWIYPGWENQTPEFPFCVPLLVPDGVQRSSLYKKNIFIPTYWPEILHRKNTNQNQFTLERSWVSNLWAIPCDHRMSTKDCIYLSKILIGLLESVDNV